MPLFAFISLLVLDVYFDLHDLQSCPFNQLGSMPFYVHPSGLGVNRILSPQ